MACFSRDIGTWGDCCVAALGCVCLLAAVLASGITMVQWHRNQATYRWTHCAFTRIDNSSWIDCQVCPFDKISGAVEMCMNETYPCIRVMGRYKDESGKNRMALIHPAISATKQRSTDEQCSLDVCAGLYPENLQAAYAFSDRIQSIHSHFQCFYNSEHFGQVFLERPHPCRSVEVLLIFVLVVFVICVLTLIVRCRFVYLNAKEARSCYPSMVFFATSSLCSLRAVLWTFAYKVFDWKLHNTQAQCNSDAQGLVEPYQEEREDGGEQTDGAAMATPITVYVEPNNGAPAEEET